jgi:flagellar FliJ protein
MALDTHRLHVLLKVAGHRVDDAGKAMAKSEQQLRDHHRRLEELRGYVREYQSRPLPANAAMMVNRERFLLRLSDAEAQQRAAVGQAERQLQHSRENWRARRQAEERLGVLNEQAGQRESRSEERKVQAQQDEIALRRFSDQAAAVHK